jgi:hypothetical protein
VLREGEAAELLAKVFHHVVALELAVHQQVEPDLLLPVDRIVDPAFDGSLGKRPR